jgi:hypothetical protein
MKGTILDHEYTIGEGRDKVAEVSKKWFRVRETYGVEIEPGQDDVLILGSPHVSTRWPTNNHIVSNRVLHAAWQLCTIHHPIKNPSLLSFTDTSS